MTKPHEVRTMSVPPEVRDVGDKKQIVGYSAKFNQRTTIGNYFTESIAPGAFTDTLSRQDSVIFCMNHDPNYLLGRTDNGTLVLREDETGLYSEVTPPDTQQARDIMENIRVGNLRAQSFAFTIDAEEWKFSKEKGQLDHRTIKKVTLYDTSVVAQPAYKSTSVGLRSAQDAWKEARSAWEASQVEEQVKASEPVEEKHVGYHPDTLLRELATMRRRAA